jgi:hypothetical protein
VTLRFENSLVDEHFFFALLLEVQVKELHEVIKNTNLEQ